MTTPWQWPPYCRWRLVDQDVIADIETIRRDLECYRLDPNAPGTYGRALDLCEAALDECANELKNFLWVNRLFIRQTLSHVQQQLILCAPRATLDSTWLSLKKKLNSIDDTERKLFFESPSRQLDDYFNGIDRATDESIARNQLRAIRKFVDEKLLAELWAAYALERKTKLSVALLIVLISVAFMLLNSDNASLPALKVKELSTKVHTLLPMVSTMIFGALGATLSAILQPQAGTLQDSAFSLPGWFYVRPLLGAVSGLFLFLIVGADLLHLPELPFLGICALAVAFGFSNDR